MAVAYVQHTTAGTSPATVSGVAAGNLLVAICRTDTSGEISGVSDDKGNTWQKAASLRPGVTESSIWYAMNVASGTTVVTVSTSAGGIQVCVVELSGCSTTDALGTGHTGTVVGGTSTWTYPTTSVTHGEWVAILAAGLETSFTVTTDPSGYTALNIGSRMREYYKTGTGAASEGPSIVWAASESGAGVIAVFGITSGGGGTVASPAQMFWFT